MSYTASEVECGWCGGKVGDGGEVACRGCYEILEEEVSDLKEEIYRLKAEVAKLEELEIVPGFRKGDPR